MERCECHASEEERGPQMGGLGLLGTGEPAEKDAKRQGYGTDREGAGKVSKQNFSISIHPTADPSWLFWASVPHSLDTT